MVNTDEMEKANDNLAAVQAERDLLERKVNELRREAHAKDKEIEAVDAELTLVKSQQVRSMAKLSVQKAKAEKQLAKMKAALCKLNDDKARKRPGHLLAYLHRLLIFTAAMFGQAALFREVSSLESSLAQAQADSEESRNWAATYREMLLKVT